ncbi:glycerol ethanol, ferric requiring protein [Ascosphaera atra]|nr:glycerol ethanol, ferric requiring protein [Ascosphaera atra]
MHLTVSVTVIMFELTGATTYILPTMIVVGVTKVVSDVLEPGQGGIADRMIKVNGLPFLDNKEEHVFGVPVSRAMTRRVVSIPDEGMTVRELRELLERDGEGERAGDADGAVAHYKKRQYQGWPIVAEGKAKVVVGWIGRMELEYAIEKAKARHGRLHGDHLQDLPVRFVPREEGSDEATDVTGALDFSAYVDRAPISVHPGLALETVIEMFKKIGPRVILIVWQGSLCGLVTMKDVLRFQYAVEEGESEGQRQISGVGAGDEEGWVERYAVKLLRFTKAAYGVLRSFWPWRREESRRPSHAGYQHVREYTDDAERGSQELDSLVEGQSQGQDSQSRRQSTSRSQSRGQG